MTAPDRYLYIPDVPAWWRDYEAICWLIIALVVAALNY